MATTYYSDLNQNFTKDKNMVTDSDELAITNSIQNILLTSKGERVGDIYFGANLSQFIFEPMDRFTAIAMAERISDNIKKYEPRIFLKGVNVYPNEDKNQYDILVEFVIRENLVPYKYATVLKKV